MIKTKNQIDEAGWDFYWRRKPNTIGMIAESSRPDIVIGYREGYEQAIRDIQDPAITINPNPKGIDVWKELYERYKATEEGSKELEEYNRMLHEGNKQYFHNKDIW